jgi:DNA polymerase III epsilon subunit-like protein
VLVNTPELRRLDVWHPTTLSPAARMPTFLRACLDRVARDLDSRSAADSIEPAGEGTAPAAHRDAARGDVAAGSPDRVLGLDCASVTRCPAGHAVRRDARTMGVELSFAGAEGSSSSTFDALLQATLATSRTTRAWCQSCNDYVPLVQTREVDALPPVLLITADPTDRAALPLWSSKLTPAGGGGAVPWLPPRLHLRVHDGHVSVTDPRLAPPSRASSGGGGGDVAEATVDEYGLVGMVVHVAGSAAATAPPPSTTGAGSTGGGASSAPPLHPLAQYHYTALLRVAVDEGALAPAPQPGQWLMFNDFRVEAVPQSQVERLSGAWKQPVAVVYQRCGWDRSRPEAVVGQAGTAAPSLSPPAGIATMEAWVAARRAAGFLFPDPAAAPHVMALDAMAVPGPRVFSLPPSIPSQPALGPAPATVMPSGLSSLLHTAGGGVVAIDAEFVAVSRERVRTLPDGTREVVEPVIMSPGRVSVTDATGRPLLDHYVALASQEAIVDHLTRFSGLVPGDLDPATSRHRLHTFKDTYAKLRGLVDGRCIFVGHGLRKDCRTLNLFIPAGQIVDTVNIYRLPAQRNLSLKFLSSHVLSADIQGVVHDSCEDAVMALRLYQHYRKVMDTEGQEGFNRLLADLYEAGRRTGFKSAVKPAGSKGARGDEGAEGGTKSAGGAGGGGGAGAGGDTAMRSSSLALHYPASHVAAITAQLPPIGTAVPITLPAPVPAPSARPTVLVTPTAHGAAALSTPVGRSGSGAAAAAAFGRFAGGGALSGPIQHDRAPPATSPAMAAAFAHSSVALGGSAAEGSASAHSALSWRTGGRPPPAAAFMVPGGRPGMPQTGGMASFPAFGRARDASPAQPVVAAAWGPPSAAAGGFRGFGGGVGMGVPPRPAAFPAAAAQALGAGPAGPGMGLRGAGTFNPAAAAADAHGAPPRMPHTFNPAIRPSMMAQGGHGPMAAATTAGGPRFAVVPRPLGAAGLPPPTTSTLTAAGPPAPVAVRGPAVTPVAPSASPAPTPAPAPAATPAPAPAPAPAATPAPAPAPAVARGFGGDSNARSPSTGLSWGDLAMEALQAAVAGKDVVAKGPPDVRDGGGAASRARSAAPAPTTAPTAVKAASAPAPVLAPPPTPPGLFTFMASGPPLGAQPVGSGKAKTTAAAPAPAPAPAAAPATAPAPTTLPTKPKAAPVTGAPVSAPAVAGAGAAAVRFTLTNPDAPLTLARGGTPSPAPAGAPVPPPASGLTGRGKGASGPGAPYVPAHIPPPAHLAGRSGSGKAGAAAPVPAPSPGHAPAPAVHTASPSAALGGLSALLPRGATVSSGGGGGGGGGGGASSGAGGGGGGGGEGGKKGKKGGGKK